MDELVREGDEVVGTDVAHEGIEYLREINRTRKKIGPALWDIVGSGIAAAEGFKYSGALSGMSADSWSLENLDAFIAKPKEFAPGTKMTFAGLKKVADRANIVAYLRSLSGSPIPLPE